MVAKSDSSCCFGNNGTGNGNSTKDVTDVSRMVPSLQEKNQAIADAYDAGRRLLVPRLIDVLFSIPSVDEKEKEVDAMGGHEEASSSTPSSSSPWVCSSHLFNSQTLAGTGVVGMTVPKFSTRIWQTGGTTHADWIVRCDVTRDGIQTTGPSSTWQSPTEVYFGGESSSSSGSQTALVLPVTGRSSKKHRDKGRRHGEDDNVGGTQATAAAAAALPSLVVSDVPSQSPGTEGSDGPTCGTGQTIHDENATTTAPPPPPPLPVQLGKKKKGKTKRPSIDVETSGTVIEFEATMMDRPCDSSQPVNELPPPKTVQPGKKKDKARRHSGDVETPSSSTATAAASEAVASIEVTTNQLDNERSEDSLCDKVRQLAANETTSITVPSRKKKDKPKSSKRRQSIDMESSLATASSLAGPEVSLSHPSENQRSDHAGTSPPFTDMEPSESTATTSGDGTETSIHQAENEGTENPSDGTSQPVEETPPINGRVGKKKGKTRRHSKDVESSVKSPDRFASDANGDHSEKEGSSVQPGKKKGKKTRTSLIVEVAKLEAPPHHPEDKRSTDSSFVDAPELPVPVVEESITTTTTTTNRYLLRHKFSDGFYYYRACQVAALLDCHPHSKQHEQEQELDQQRDDVEIQPKWIHSMTQNAVDEYVSSLAESRLQAASSTIAAIPASLTRDMNQLLGEVLAGVAAAEALKIGFVPRITTIKWKEQLVTYRYI